MKGFSLLELMIVLVISGILCALSLPLYSQHVTQARRFEAQINLMKLANALEKYYLLNNTYQDATLASLGLPEKNADNQYQLKIATATAADYSLQAIPLQKQAQNDLMCASLILDSSGKKAITGTGHLDECWRL